MIGRPQAIADPVIGDFLDLGAGAADRSRWGRMVSGWQRASRCGCSQEDFFGLADYSSAARRCSWG
jgi:hypothetical protein